MPVTVNLEKFTQGPNESQRKANIIVDGVEELQSAVEGLEAIVGMGGQDVVVTGCLNGLRGAGIAMYRSLPVPIDEDE